MGIIPAEKGKGGLILSYSFKKFNSSLEDQVDRVIFGSKTMRQSLEEIVAIQMNKIKAAEIYENGSAATNFMDSSFTEPRPMRLRSGEDHLAEEQANEILVNSRRQEGKNADRREWLTTEQILLRQHKEVYNQNGFPDSSLVSGMYKRTHNPNAGNRPGKNGKSEE
jgi:hypothetical protein